MKAFLHPLDYACGTWFYLADNRVDIVYKPGPDNFYVDEIVDWDRAGYNPDNGEYLVYRVVKKGLDTYSVIDRLASLLNIPVTSVLYLGLKDRDATATQYVFIKKNILRRRLENINDKKFSAYLYGYIARKPRKDLLIGNRFKIIIRPRDPLRLFDYLTEYVGLINRHGLPSYYGYQRFGTRRFNTHLLGRFLVEGRADLFLDELLYRLYPGETVDSLFSRLRRVFPRRLEYEYLISKHGFRGLRELLAGNSSLYRLFIDAYQAYLYNLLLSAIISRDGWAGLDRELPMPSCRDKVYEELLGVNTSNLPSGRGYCWFRRGLFRLRNVVVKIMEESVLLGFTLRRGLYASIVLRELFKSGYIVS